MATKDTELDEINKKRIKDIISNRFYKSANNWFLFSYFYLKTIRELIDNLPSEKDEEKVANQKRNKIITTHYLFKHTLELVLKYVAISINKNNVKTHDTLEISKTINYQAIFSKIRKDDVKKEFKWTDDHLKKIITLVNNDLQELSEKYLFHLNLLKNIKTGSFIIEDVQNEIFKYPITENVRFQIDPFALFNMPIDEINEFKEDYKKLLKSFNYLQAIFYYSGF